LHTCKLINLILITWICLVLYMYIYKYRYIVWCVHQFILYEKLRNNVVSHYTTYNKSSIHQRMRNILVYVLILSIHKWPYLCSKIFWNNNWDTFYSNFCINDVKNVFLYSFCMNDLEMWHKWFLNMMQGRSRVFVRWKLTLCGSMWT
jgi:hypothetical protein